MAGKMKRSEASSSSSDRRERGESVVVDWGRRKSTCGYCRSGSRTSISHGLWAYSITADDYQDLLDRGWRRSGSFLYKPEMERTCCPSYTIRLLSRDFVPSKEQLRVSRKMQRFLDGTLEHRTSEQKIVDPNVLKDVNNRTRNKATSSVQKVSLATKDDFMDEEEQFLQHLSEQINHAVQICIKIEDFPNDLQYPKPSVKRVSQAKKKILLEDLEDLQYTSNIAFQIFSTLRREKSGGKDVNKSKSLHTVDESGISPKLIAEKLVISLNQVEGISQFSIRACNGHINFYSSQKQPSSPDDVSISISKESIIESGSKRSGMDINPGCPQKKRRLEIRMKRSSFDPEEYALYRRYQIKVHNDAPDHVTESSYRRFLVDTPIIFVPPTGDSTVPPCGFGSFHQQYVIDGKLVAVGVVDILPKCLSSKYLFWDPDFAFLSLGKYSALQEIDWVKENQAHCASLQYYYLGYYIHSCRKMRYKASYNPSELLCPLRYEWVPFEIAKHLLDKRPYVVLSDFPTLQKEEAWPLDGLESVSEMQDIETCQEAWPLDESSDDDSSPETNGLASSEMGGGDVSNILIGSKGSRVRYSDLRQALGPTKSIYLENQLHGYQRVVGVELSERMVYSLG